MRAAKIIINGVELEVGGISGVYSFNGRAGAVIPQATDYDKFFAYPRYTYDGVNIKDKFKGEMDYTEPWIWVQQRLAARDISGLHIKDFFEVTAGGNLLQMQIADINHDLGFMDTEITAFHIDFISKDLWPELHVWNKVNYNNGIAAEANPWLCSDLKAWLNSEKGEVPNEDKASPQTVSVDYSATGVFDKLPVSLQSIIVERRNLEPTRYTAGQLLTDDAGFEWKNIGKLWVPNEIEVYSFIVWGTRSGYNCGSSHQFPMFLDGRNRIKHLGTVGNRCTWWLRSALSNSSTSAASVGAGASSYNAAWSNSVGAPVCFRISG